jgi:uncharacterized membrane protein YgaE (UPF0421/DUF939 family)
MPVAARRVFRLSFAVALALVCGYGLDLDIPFIAPIFALLLTAPPGLPMTGKKLFALVLGLMLILAVGLLLIRPLQYYPLTAVLIVACGLYLSSFMAVNLGKGPVALFLTVSLTMISALGTLSWELAVTAIDDIALGIVVAILCQWVIYPFFPEDSRFLPPDPPVHTPAENNWIALRATAIILPAYLLTLTNPTFYLPIIMKATALGQQSGVLSARDAGRELLGSTFLGGCFAILLWVALGISTNLWMFFLWILLFVVFCAAKFYQIASTRYPPSYWSNVVVTTLILLGSAVQDTETGNDVYKAFAVRMSLFMAVTLYAWLAIELLERWKTRLGAAASAEVRTMP